MCHWVSPELTNKTTTTTTTNPGLRVSETPRVSGFCFLSGFRQRFWGSFSMALNGSPIWGRVKTTPPPFSHLGVSGYGSGRSGFAWNLWFGSRKWECCSLAQRAITLVDDEKPIVPVADTSGPVEEALSSESMRFHKDLNLLPKPLTASALSSSPADGSKVRVAYQGSPGAYSEAAALKAYPKCETVPCDGFESTFKAVELWLVDKAVLPIENSFGGSVHRNYDLLLRHRLHIVGEVKLLVNHCLLGLPSVKLEEIKRVFSHPQALAQCEMTLTDLGTMRLNADDTAGAAKMVASLGLKDTGAIASARAAEIYGLDILAQNIQDDDDNVTRFLILAREPIIPGTDRPYKTSIVFTLVEGPGVLFKAFAVFALREIELTKIESRPQRQRPLRVVDDSNEGSAKYFDYLFYVDFEASMAEPRAQYALEHLQEFARFLRILGSYPIDLKP